MVAVGAVPSYDVMLVILLEKPSENGNRDNRRDAHYDDYLRVRIHAVCKMKKKIHNEKLLKHYTFGSEETD